MPDDLQHHFNTSQYSSAMAQQYFNIALIPDDYERALNKCNSAQESEKYARNNAPEDVQQNIEFYRHSNTTAILAYNLENHEVTIAFDPTQREDIRDNFWKWGRDQNIGGQVHGGMVSDLMRPYNADGLRGYSIIDRLETRLYQLSDTQDRPLTVNFTGFSRGGALSGMTSAEMMNRGVFDDPATIRLNDVYLFAPPAYGDTNFTQSYNALASSLGVNAITTRIQGDPQHDLLTPNAENPFKRHSYGQVGQEVTIIPAQSDLETSIHSREVYEAVLNAQTLNNNTIEELTPDIPNGRCRPRTYRPGSRRN